MRWARAGIGPAAVAAAFGLLAAWSWGRWTDVHIDFGSELYIPWRITEGEALYRDIAHRNGPLSHYLNAWLFGAFGVSIRTLVVANLLVLAAICSLLYRYFLRAGDSLAATLACLVFLGVFGFSQYVGIANFNYVTPYHHAQTHGLALSIGMIAALSAALRERRTKWWWVAGGCLGGALLTKAEIAGPALVTAVVGLGLSFRPGNTDTRRWPGLLGLGGGALLPGLFFFGVLALAMPASEAFSGILGNWRHLGGEVFADRFYILGAGLDDVGGNLLRAGRMFAVIAAFAAATLAADRWLPGGSERRPLAIAAGFALFGLLVWKRDLVAWEPLARALPLTTAAIVAALIAALASPRGNPTPSRDDSLAPLLLWSVFSFLLLGKLILKVRFGQYGFTLAMPATLLLVVLLLELPRRLLGHRPGGGVLARALVVAVLAAGVAYFLRWSDAVYQRSHVAVGSGADRIWVANPRGAAVAAALAALERRMPPEATLLVLPEGVSLNYWLRRRNPSHFLLFLPTEFDAFGERAMLADIRARPPDFVALVHRRPEEFGVGFFGRDPRNGRAIVAWIESHYRPFERLGKAPFEGRDFGIVLLERRPDVSFQGAGGGAGPGSSLRYTAQ